MKISPLSIDKSVKTGLLYLALLLPILILIAGLWSIFIDGNLYYSSDKIPILDFHPPFVHGPQVGDYFIAPQIVVHSLWFFSVGIVVYMPWMLLKKLLVNKGKSTKAVVTALSIFSGFIILSIVVFAIYFIWTVKNQKEPRFFPFDEPSAEYSIVKTSEDAPFMVKYKGPNAFPLNPNSDGSISVIIGKTKYNLDEFLGKNIYISKGDFVSSSQQCIANTCKDIAGPYVVVNIDEIQKIVEAKPRDRVIEYQVVEGDTLSIISEKFSVSTNTIKWANNLNSDSIRLGQSLKILPVTGVMHTVSKNETIYTIAKKYRVDVKKIIDFPYNTFNDDKYSLTTDQTIIIPDGVKP